MSLCLAAGGALKAIAASVFTLAWSHSVEKVRWEETWETVPTGLRLIEARIKGSGAGMEPAPHARLQQGWWIWEGNGQIFPRLTLGHSGQAGQWHLCIEGNCRPLHELIATAKQVGPVTISSCDK